MTFNALLGFQGLSRSCKNGHFFYDFQGPVATLVSTLTFKALTFCMCRPSVMIIALLVYWPLTQSNVSHITLSMF